ncbi:hypothetical protein AK972_6010 [Pseudomonas yamanorum]|nr:hypothetical protein AK972_6010 [Pseudomonas yamanorum]
MKYLLTIKHHGIAFSYKLLRTFTTPIFNPNGLNTAFNDFSV